MLIDDHIHMDKYGDLLDEALKQIETARIFNACLQQQSYGSLDVLFE